MKEKGMGLTLGVMLLFNTAFVGAASASKVSNEEEIEDDVQLQLLTREAADTIKTVHERELAKRTVVPYETWLNRKAANSIKSIYEKELSERTVIPSGK